MPLSTIKIWVEVCAQQISRKLFGRTLEIYTEIPKGLCGFELTPKQAYNDKLALFAYSV